MTTAPAVCDEFITLGGLRFHYREFGDPLGPPLVLLHAYLSHARSWDTVAAALAGRFRVLALDQRGHGESEWTLDYHETRLIGDLALFVDALRLDSFAVVGFSIGGFTACSYALLEPARVTHLVMSECFVEDPFEHDAPSEVVEHISAMRALPTAFTGTADVVAAAAAAAYRPLAPFAEEQELRRWMLDGLMQLPNATWTWRYDPVLRVPGHPARLNPSASVLRARLAAVRTPALMVVGAESFHLAGASGIASTHPETPLAIVPDAGHWVPLDNPSGFHEIVGEFLWGE